MFCCVRQGMEVTKKSDKMIINKTGKIIENLYMLGHSSTPVYLLDGDVPVLFDAGYAYLGERYVKEIKQITGDKQPGYCFISHSHFDHCGSVAMFKKNFPFIKIVCSKKAKNIFHRPNAIKLIKELSNNAELLAKRWGIECKGSEPFEPFEIDMTADDKDTIKVSKDLTVEVLETPGHTRDCLSYYIPGSKILFPSEAIGVPDKTRHIFSCFLVDYDMYYESILRLKSLESDVLCLGHNFAYTGKDAQDYIEQSIQKCEEFLNIVETCLVEEKGDVEKVKWRIKKLEYDGKTGMVQPEPAYLLNLEASIRVIKKRMGLSE